MYSTKDLAGLLAVAEVDISIVGIAQIEVDEFRITLDYKGVVYEYEGTEGAVSMDAEITESAPPIEDARADLENFKSTVNNKKETIEELIKSVDKSLEKFNVQKS